MARRKQRDRLVEQARAETQLRYGPEVRGLRALLAEARTDLKFNLRSERGAAAGIQAATRAALPDIRRIYETAGHSAQQADADVATAVAGLSPAADSARAVAATESGAAKTRLAEAMARTEADLGRRQIEAASGRAYGERAARQQYASQTGKLRGQQRDLEGEMGLFATTTYRDLSDADRKFRQEGRRIRISLGNLRNTQRSTEADITGIDPATGEPTAAERNRRRDDARADKEKKHKPRFTPLQRRDARAAWDKGWNIISADKPKPEDRVDYLKYLGEKGVPAPIAAGIWQKYRLGGVRRPVRRRLRRDYGLKPKVRQAGGILGDVQDTVGRLTG
jgi:hypothetical protein